jgi:hypothetical protein
MVGMFPPLKSCFGKAYRVSFAINNVARQIMAAKEPGDYRAVQIWNGDRPIALIGNPVAAAAAEALLRDDPEALLRNF